MRDFAPRLEVVGYELTIRPCRGWWSRYEGCVIQLVQSSGAEKPYRNHYLPRAGWARSHSRDRLERRLRAMLNKRDRRARERQPERIALSHTMAGWD